VTNTHFKKTIKQIFFNMHGKRGIACRCPSKSLSLSQLMLMSSEAKSVLVGPPAPEASLSPPSAARESVTQHGKSSAPGLQP